MLVGHGRGAASVFDTLIAVAPAKSCSPGPLFRQDRREDPSVTMGLFRLDVARRSREVWLLLLVESIETLPDRKELLLR